MIIHNFCAGLVNGVNATCKASAIHFKHTARAPPRRVCAHFSGHHATEQYRRPVTILIAAAVTLSAALPPPAIPNSQISPSADVIVLQDGQISNHAVKPAPDVHAGTAEPGQTVVDQQQQQQQQQQLDEQQQQQWWAQDADAWQELLTPAEVTAYMTSAQPAPAWPALASDTLSPKLRLLEFYAGWCPACKAAAPDMAAVASDPSLTAVCSFARANVDRVKPLMKQLGISRIPAVVLLAPGGQVLDTLPANGQVVRDAILQHSAALAPALRTQTQSAGLDVPPSTPQLTPGLLPSVADESPLSEDTQTGSSSSSSSNISSSAGSNGSTINTSSVRSNACSIDPSAAAAACSHPVSPTIHLPLATPSTSEDHAAADLAAAKAEFMNQYGSMYGYQGWLEQHYQQEVGSRLGPNRHYLDYTGSALYPSSLLQAVYLNLMTHTYGNPHSAAAAAVSGVQLDTAGSSAGSLGPAAASAAVVEEAALAVLRHLNADPAQYQVIFTRSATEALKLVGEMFPWFAPNNSSSSSSSSLQGADGGTSTDGSVSPSGSTDRTKAAGMLETKLLSRSMAAAGTGSGSSFIYTRSNHNSVLGIGAYAADAEADLRPLSDADMAAWLAAASSRTAAAKPAAADLACPQQPAAQAQGRWAQLPVWQSGSQVPQQPPLLPPAAPEPAAAGGAEAVHYHLLAYPAEDNFAGLIYPLHWINQAQAASTPADRYLVLLDAAAFLPTHPLDLTAYPADFVVASFYKMFGYPSGLGALVLRTELVPLLHKIYFGGGSVALATPEGCWHIAKCDPGAALTDGTPNFLGAAALTLAYDNWDSRGGIKAVQEHTQALTSWLDQHLSSLHHSNGSPLLLLYGHHGQGKQQQHQLAVTTTDGGGHVQTASTGDGFGQGSIFNFQVLDVDGRPISYSRIEREAEAAGISLRSGCVCNPGACYDALGLQADEVKMLAGQKEGCGDDLDFVTVMRPVPAGDGDSNDVPVAEGLVATQVPLGSVRASFGWASTFEDAYALVSFLKGYIT